MQNLILEDDAMKLLYSIHKCDVFMFTWMLNTRVYQYLVKASRYVSKTGDGLLYVLIMALLYWQFGFENEMLKAIMLGFVIERPLYFILKNSLKRSRPEYALQNFQSVIIPSDKFSFPSGHTSAAFMMATILGYFIPPLLIALYCWAAIVGISRVILGVHFPTDVMVGVILGVSAATISLG
jgi:undecaprenyl-diphosphatase